MNNSRNRIYFILKPKRFISFLLLIILGCGTKTAIECNNITQALWSCTFPRNAPPNIYLWVTTTTTDGNLGGLNAANNICETEAIGVGLPAGPDYIHRAYLGTSTNNPATYITDARSVRRPNNTLIANNWTSFVDTTIFLINSITAAFVEYWTGHNSFNQPAASACFDWTSNDPFIPRGEVGSGDMTDDSRLLSGGETCNLVFSLLCVSY